MKYKKGTKFTVCNHEELKEKGWAQYRDMYRYEHKDFDGIITYDMIDKYQGKTLTVRKLAIWQSDDKCLWYKVDENFHQWPVSIFLEISNWCIICIEGMTPIDGWFICKTCGTNLREIK